MTSSGCGISVIIISSSNSLTVNPLVNFGYGKIWDIVFDGTELNGKVNALLEYKKNNPDEIYSISKWYKDGIKNGAIGGKLVGAGGGGFLMFYSADNEKLRQKMHQHGLEEVQFDFDFRGTHIVL